MTKPTDELIGSLVLGRYRIVRPLAQGGMGAVYLARVEGAAGFSRPVVIKRVLPHLSETESSKAQFIREARILSNLQHPGIVGVIDFAEEHGALLMVLDYVHGYHLGQWLRYVRETRGQLPWELAVLVIMRVLAALHYAHSFTRSDGSRAEVVHRDVSPGNVLLDVDGNVRLLDFGIALMAEDKAGSYQTQDGTFKGKLPYVAPEIYSGEKATPKSDVYATGVLLYQLLSGQNPFAAKEMSETVRRVLTLVPSPLHTQRGDVPTALDGVIAKAMAKDPATRYQSADAFAADLRALLTRREDEIFAELSATIRRDFTGDMPSVLHLCTLEMLEASWRDAHSRLSDDFTPLKSSAPPAASETVVVNDGAPQPAAGFSGSSGSERAERRGVTGRQLALFMLGTALLAGGIATAVAILTRPGSPPKGHSFLVVEGANSRRNDARQSGSDSQASRPDPVPEPSPSDTRMEPSAAPSSPTRSTVGKPARAAPKGNDAATELSRAFGRKQGAVQRCFQAHIQNLEGTPQIAIHFAIDKAGHVTSATILPAQLGSTALGQCLVGVARSTEFGPQPEPRAFTIPIHARSE